MAAEIPQPSERVQAMMLEAQTNFRNHQTYSSQHAHETAAAVVADGGEADRQTFVYAFHGILPGRELDQYQIKALDTYDALHQRFGSLATGTPIAEIETSYGNRNIAGLGLTERAGLANAATRFMIKQVDDGGYFGEVILPLTNVCRWDSSTPADRPRRKFLATHRLLGVSGMTFATTDTATNGLAAGLNEVLKIRTFGDGHYSYQDAQFFGRLQTFFNITKLLEPEDDQAS